MFGQSTRKHSNTDRQHSFAKIPSVSVPRSSFDRSCGLKTTFDGGYLVPVFLDEALPGDTFEMSMTSFARLATPLHPIMDNMRLETFFFAVPCRLLWDNWQKFMGEQDDPGDSTDFLIPTVGPGAFGQPVGSLWDYFGLPIYTVSTPDVSALWHRAYNLIWNEWFRDQNLQDSIPKNRGDGPDAPSDYALQRRGKRHDYFTSCLPFPQKGPAVQLPLGDSAVVTMDSPQVLTIDGNAIVPQINWQGETEELQVEGSNRDVRPKGTNTQTGDITWDTTGMDVDLGGATGLADLSAATASTINQIREAFQIQRLFERDARGGTRYTEILRAHFGVTSPDFRLQRPEYLGGGSTAIGIHPVPQTSGTVSGGDASEQGNLAAFGVTSNTFRPWVKSFTEHCVIMGFVSARADLNYQRNVPRMFSRSTRFDFYWPSFAHLGEQTVLNKEIAFYDDASDDLVFGYQERWAEYRYKPSTITGLMRSPELTHTTSLDTWHLAQDYGDDVMDRPLLNASFIEDNPPIDRVIAVTSEPHFLLDCFFQYRCTRPMPTYSVPGQIDRF